MNEKISENVCRRKGLRNNMVLSAVIAILLVATLAFIWGNSVESREQSHEKSALVLKLLTPLLELFVGKGNVTEHIVRKLAHFAEFAVLGSELTALMCLHGKPRFWRMLVLLEAGFCAAAIDETIQIFSDRGSRLSDVLLDFGGICAGTLFVLFLAAALSKIKRCKSAKHISIMNI